MNIKKTKKPTKNIVVFIIAIVVTITTLTLGYLIVQDNSSQSSENDRDLSSQESKPNKSIDNIKNDSKNPTGDPEETDNQASTDPAQPTGEITSDGSTPQRNNQASESNVTITRVDSTDTNVTIAALVHGIPEGTCKFSLSSSNKIVERTTDIVAGPTYHACQVIIPRDQVSHGQWNISAKATGGDKTATANSEQNL